MHVNAATLSRSDVLSLRRESEHRRPSTKLNTYVSISPEIMLLD